MIKARGGNLVLLGLSRMNVDRMVAGLPVLFDGADVGLDGIRITIVYGETERAIIDQLDAEGVLGPGMRDELLAAAESVGL